MSEQVKVKRTLQGKVTSNKMDKTIVVKVERKVKHALYGKYVKRSTKVHAHDAENSCNIGDIVIIAETRPIAKTKSWQLVKIIERGDIL
ncbi:MAG: 30S ribosomal protein S17 [Gammaproteobacteria bacterium]|nr:30S ribosomal protein S17 [Gammaproteobacteria bacterium]